MNLRSSSMPDTLKLLPTMYSSGVVYRRYFNDCSSAQTVFAPVDSYAQSMQVVIRGLGNIQYTINQPNGQVYSNSLIGTYLNDQLNGWTVLDIRKACDDSWENNGNVNLPYCYKIGLGQNWTSARDICYMAGAYLADDSTLDADNFLASWASNTVDYWIGLNDVNQTGYYFWDRGPYLPPATFNGSQYSNWGTGQPVNDTVRKCVSRLAKWYE
uniref:C-type lectin domain-containing protein n=1 Tax=Acrobeloides nanus TaxID=290746 RepID=A0A914CYP0_9BILA